MSYLTTRLSKLGYTLHDVGRGRTAPTVVPMFLEGYVANVNNAWVDVWSHGGAYAFPAAGGVRMEIVSTSAQDGPAGTGILTARISYLDVNFAEQEETVTLNGLVAAPTAAVNIRRINYFAAETAGTSEAAVGTVTLRLFGGGATYARIEIGDAREYRAIYTVPAGKRALMLDWLVSAGASSAGHHTRFAYATNYDFTHGHVHTFISDILQMSVQDGAIQLDAPTGVVFGATSDIKIRAISDNVAADVKAGTFSLGLLETL